MVQIKTLFLWFSHIYPYLLPIEKILQIFCDIQKQLIIELRRRKVNIFVFKIRLTYSLKYLEKIIYWTALTKFFKFATTHLSRYRNVKKKQWGSWAIHALTNVLSSPSDRFQLQMNQIQARVKTCEPSKAQTRIQVRASWRVFLNFIF